MPQMGSLPWVTLWIFSLMLVLMFLIMIFYTPYYTIKEVNFSAKTNKYKWVW
uniref:ATP synthase F0 subunit 8 n=1 Tax=Mongoloniscus sinensis TaxID=1783568 RepID=A0A3G3LKN7_9CRUS|nr:ATP synthase F0 subunit 8 [Mongoloniscus sinensis]AYQ93281.1 ATP synthase F0 subunit 8 [Mongoloniscus sinensis]